MSITEETLQRYKLRLIEQEKSTHTIAIFIPLSLFWQILNRRFQNCR